MTRDLDAGTVRHLDQTLPRVLPLKKKITMRLVHISRSLRWITHRLPIRVLTKIYGNTYGKKN